MKVIQKKSGKDWKCIFKGLSLLEDNRLYKGTFEVNNIRDFFRMHYRLLKKEPHAYTLVEKSD